jgi:hypothetical protein
MPIRPADVEGRLVVSWYGDTVEFVLNPDEDDEVDLAELLLAYDGRLIRLRIDEAE